MGTSAPRSLAARLRAARPSDPGFELAFALLALAAAWPLLYVSYPPIQDLPQHLAAIRVLHDFDSPGFAFRDYFVVDLWKTQYLAYYAAADLLAHALDVEAATRALIVASVVATPYSVRALLAALGRDRRLALLAFGFVYNAHLLLGFLNFLAAIPLMFLGTALSVQQRMAPSPGRALALTAVAVLGFYTHVVPFALLGLAAGLVALGRDPRKSVLRLLPLLPSGLAALHWLNRSPAGQATWTAARGSESGRQPVFTPFEPALAQLPRWLTDILHGPEDRLLLWSSLALLSLAVSGGLLRALLERRQRPAQPTAAATDEQALRRSLALRLALISPLCALLYFVAPSSYDWIWPIAERFPLLALLWLLPALPTPGPRLSQTLAVAAFAVACASYHYAGQAFAAFEREEVGDFDAALAAIPPGQRVAGLMFERGSRHVAFSPFIHFVAYYQARRGGAVMFSFADFPQSPFAFRDDNRPPPVPPRWEWLPQRVRPRELDWYQYVLTRGGPGVIARPGSGFERIHQQGRYRVYRKLEP
ncbi:MAG: hypothetical protein OEZ06_19715 [Myxococcales bacterium]|nr:hypothetical protein [Myxococcales bacterium]